MSRLPKPPPGSRAAPVSAPKRPPEPSLQRFVAQPYPNAERPQASPPGAAKAGADAPSTKLPGPSKARTAWLPPPAPWAASAEAAVAAHPTDGGQSLTVTLRDPELGPILCVLHIAPDGRMTATFVAHDAHTRRLLDSEVGRLRVQLEQRGLRAHAVRVVAGPSPDESP